MAYSVADKHTDGNRNHDGSHELRALGALVNSETLR